MKKISEFTKQLVMWGLILTLVSVNFSSTVFGQQNSGTEKAKKRSGSTNPHIKVSRDELKANAKSRSAKSETTNQKSDPGENITKAKPREGAGNNPNIKVRRGDGLKTLDKSEVPNSKGGTQQTRQAQGRIHFDSRSAEYMDCYVDGYFVGSIAPYGDLYVYRTRGNRRLFCETYDGELWWGPQTVPLRKSYRWTLTD